MSALSTPSIDESLSETDIVNQSCNASFDAEASMFLPGRVQTTVHEAIFRPRSKEWSPHRIPQQKRPNSA